MKIAGDHECEFYCNKSGIDQTFCTWCISESE